ncbi:hypothetical protein PIB30_084746 [Stylosanthes scabra]|uniref:Uncharacterized protein n=1 Tax=Stylosanthes scabra TaxID=79078 RepID=A0ABU6TU03_9FABA|nr:hypothetical protein [Stylosanthes scabra]
MNTATLNTTTTRYRDVSNNTLWMCERFSRSARSRGIFFGDNPLSYTMPVLILQSSIVGLVTTTLQILFTPLGQSSFVPQMLMYSGRLSTGTINTGTNQCSDEVCISTKNLLRERDHLLFWQHDVHVPHRSQNRPDVTNENR